MAHDNFVAHDLLLHAKNMTSGAGIARNAVRREETINWLPSKVPAVVEAMEVRRIAIFRALYLGDLLLAVPALRAIRRQFPQAEITFIGLPWAKDFARRYAHYIDRFVEFVGYPGIKEVEVETERAEHFLVEQQAYSYDLVVQMHGSGLSSNPFSLALGGKVTAGYYSVDAPAELALHAVYPEHQHEIYRNLGLAYLLGCQELDPRLEFPLYEQDYAEANTLLKELASDSRPWIGIHAGARPPARRWPADYFASLADDLVRRFDAHILLTGSAGEEATVQAVQDRMKMPVMNLVGATSLGGLGALISKLDLFISNDTGPAHVAAAVDTPSITLFGPADYVRWAPLDQQRHPTLRHPVVCSPCGYWECPIDHRCLRWLEPEIVFITAQKLLRGEISSL